MNQGDKLYGDGIQAQFPGKVWDGTSLSRIDPNAFRGPDKFDWEQAVAEIQAVQEAAVKTAMLKITNAELLAAPSTPYDIAPAPGAGNFYWVQSAIALANFAVAYGNVDGAAEIAIASHDLNMIFAEVPSTAYFGGTGRTIFALVPSGLEIGLGAQAYSDNQPLSFAFSNGSSGDMTGGDPSNYILVVVRYVVLPGPT